jgi:hypothetical protein
MARRGAHPAPSNYAIDRDLDNVGDRPGWDDRIWGIGVGGVDLAEGAGCAPLHCVIRFNALLPRQRRA